MIKIMGVYFYQSGATTTFWKKSEPLLTYTSDEHEEIKSVPYSHA